MEGKSPNPKRSERATKGNAPAHLDDYYVQPTVRPQEPPASVGHHLPPSSGVRRRKAGKENIHPPQPPPLLPQSQQTNAAYPFQQTLATHPCQPHSAAYSSQHLNAAYLSQHSIAARPPQPPQDALSQPQNPIAAGPSAPQENVPAEEDDTKSVKSYHSTHSMFSQMSVGAIARRKQLEAELYQEKLIADMEEEVDKAELEVRKRKLERMKKQSVLLTQIEKNAIEVEYGVDLGSRIPQPTLNAKALEFISKTSFV